MPIKIRESGFYHSKIKDWPEGDRPREKMLEKGAESLTDAELIAIILRSGSGDITAVDLAKLMMQEFKTLNDLAGRTVGELKQFPGIGDTKAVTVISALELGRRLGAEGIVEKLQVVSPETIALKYIPLMGHLKQEEFHVVELSSSNKVIGEYAVTKGSLNASIVHPREVFKRAIVESAASIIVLHNHPSGNPNPSKEDIEVTEKLKEAGKVVGIELIDHLIIAGKEYYSFAENNYF